MKTKYETIAIKKQECDDVNFDFTIQAVITQALVNAVKELGGISVNDLISLCYISMFDLYGNRNIDALQVFNYRGLEFWAISNKEADEEYLEECHCVTWLLPSDY